MPWEPASAGRHLSLPVFGRCLGGRCQRGTAQRRRLGFHRAEPRHERDPLGPRRRGGIEQAPYKGYGTRFTPIPLIFFENKWVHAFGTTLDLKIGKWNNVSMSLRGKYALGDGYKQSDAPILNGMQNRNGAFWYGPALSWHTAFGTLSGDFLAGGNKGEMASIDLRKSFEYGNFSIEPHVGAEWLGSKYVDYYYGVRPSEVRAGRPAYSGKSTYDMSVGARVDYQFTRHQIVILDVGASHLGSGITDSPLVGKRFIPQARIGYLYQFN